MLIEMRTYTFLPGKMPGYLALLEKEGLALQLRHLGRCLGYFTTEVGTVNQMIQLWAYENAADREERRARMWADASWERFADQALPMILRQENCLLKPTSFSPAPIVAQVK